MDIVYDVLKITIPSLLVLGTAYTLLKMFLENESKNREAFIVNENKGKLLELKMKSKELVTPIRLQAFERVVLLLERISPNSLVMRVYRPGMTALQLQSELIHNIRDEFEHNLSQQVYMSSQAWELVREAKEQMTRMINTAATQLEANATGTELSQRIFELTAKYDQLPVNTAIEFVKKEIQENF